MYAPGVKIIPERDTILLGKIDDKEVPEYKYRTIHYKVSWDAEYVDWHKLNHDAQGRKACLGNMGSYLQSILFLLISISGIILNIMHCVMGNGYQPSSVCQILMF